MDADPKAKPTTKPKLDINPRLVSESPEMLIPIRCMSCGNVIADKWNYYKTELAKRRIAAGLAEDDRYAMDGTQIPQTLEKSLLDKLGFKRPCCRKHFLTHVDLMEKI